MARFGRVDSSSAGFAEDIGGKSKKPLDEIRTGSVEDGGSRLTSNGGHKRASVISTLCIDEARSTFFEQ